MNKRHVERMKKTLKENNRLDQYPILVNQNMEIIDGQHRLAACEELRIEVHYEVINNANMDDVRSINYAQKPWSGKDFIESYAKQGITDYQILLDFIEEYELGQYSAIALLSDGSAGGDISLRLRSGNFKVKNLNKAIIMAKALQSIRPFTEDNAWRSVMFTNAFRMIYEKVSIEDLVDNLSKRDTRLEKKASIRDYLRQFEDVYNHYKHFQNRIHLY